MADDDEDQEDPNDPGHARLSVNDLRALRKASRERDDLNSQLAAQNRELAFAKAKLDLDDPKLKYFIKGYEGELTPEAIRAQAEADGFFHTPQQPRNNEEVGAQERMTRASSGATETPNVKLEDMIRQASSPDEVMKLMVQAGYPTTWNRPEDR